MSNPVLLSCHGQFYAGYDSKEGPLWRRRRPYLWMTMEQATTVRAQLEKLGYKGMYIWDSSEKKIIT